MPKRHTRDPGFLTLSNLLSLSRIPLGLSLLAVTDQRALALIVAVGALTDLLDGLIARLTHTVSEIGVLLDPFCDKFFVLAGLVSFLPGGGLDWAGFLILILRDVFTAGSYLLARLVGRVLPFRSRTGGKVTTALQVATFFALIFSPRLVPLLVFLVGAVSVYAIIDYGLVGLRARQRGAAGG
jgi:phosphatidylglycerophosphate synthase